MNKTRIEAFSDGVLAILITIMVLEIKVPHGSEWSDLMPLLPVVGAYIMSFIFIGIYWGNHHHLLHTVKQVSPGMIWANMHLLFWLSLVPFVTAWMGENHFSSHTVAAYSAVLLLCGIAFTILQSSIQRSNPPGEELRIAYEKVSRKGITSVILYLAAIPLSFVNTWFAGALIVTVAVTWLIPDRNIERALKNLHEH